VSTRGTGGDAALAGVVALVGAGAEREAALPAVLELIAGATGALTVAMYLGDPTAGGLELRGVGGPGDGVRPATGIRPATATGVCAALAEGWDADGGGPLAAELASLGLTGGRVIPTRVGGRTVAALGLAPAIVDDDAGERSLRAAAQVLGLAMRNTQLSAGVRDRVRELDRQAVQLGALTEIARRVAGSLEPAEAHRLVVAEARALVRADAAILFLPGTDGRLRAVAGDGMETPDPSLDEQAARAMAGQPAQRGRRVAVTIPGPEAAGGSAGGVIAVVRERDDFVDDDVERLRGLAAQAAIALANARLLSDLRREQEERRSLAAAIVLAQEQERRRIAEDLHDGPVQELVGVGLLLDALAGDLASASPAAVEDVARAAAAARESVRGLRRAIADLHPLLLEQLGFAAAVRSSLERLEWSGVQVDLDVASADGLPETERTVAFRIVQEAIANVARHAGATSVAVRARAQGAAVVIEVIDDGRGFDPSAPRAGVAEGHLGLAAIEERARLAGGELTIRSAPGGGTVVALVLPTRAGVPQAGGESRESASDSASSSAKRSSTTS